MVGPILRPQSLETWRKFDIPNNITKAQNKNFEHTKAQIVFCGKQIKTYQDGGGSFAYEI